ncbi:hypothetical protein JCM6882_004542 [Rhodosporidiobolus microsporus]
MRPSTLALSALSIASTVHAFTYSIGVGKNEVDGQPGIGFDPSYTVIVPHSDGNDLAFEFLAGVHRVVQTSGVDAPCSPSGGFDSGVVRVPQGTLQGQGPTQTFQIENDTAVMYFADIGEDFSACYLGAVFCINTDESSPQACHAARSAALALGAQYGVTATPSNTISGSSTSAASSSSSATNSANSTTSAPASTGSGASRTASANEAAASESAGAGNGAAGAVKAGGVLGALVALAGVVAMV